METPLQGSCQCGAIHYSLGAEPLLTYACHCHDCQKRTGSAFSMGLIVPTSALAVEGELSAWQRTSDEGNTNSRYSCASCGNIIYGIGDSNPDLAKLQAGTLDDTSRVAPDVHIWTCRKQAWVSLADEVPQFDTQPDAMTLLQAAMDYRART